MTPREEAAKLFGCDVQVEPPVLVGNRVSPEEVAAAVERLSKEMAAMPAPIETRRRLKVFLVPEDMLFDLFVLMARGTTEEWIAVPRCKSVPVTARVVSVHHCWDRKSFAFTCEDASFEEVPGGTEIPRQVENDFRFEFVRKEVIETNPVYGPSPLKAIWKAYKAGQKMAKEARDEGLPIPLLDPQGRVVGRAIRLREQEGKLVADFEVSGDWINQPDIQAAMKKVADIIIKESTAVVPSSQPERRDNPFMPKNP